MELNEKKGKIGKPKKKYIYIAVAIILICICAALFGESSEAGHEGEAKIPAASSALSGIDYEDAIRKFEKSGFTNIQTKRLDDLITGWMTKEGEVERVSIGGDTEFSADTWVPADIEVVITYHAFPEKEAEEEPEEVEETSSGSDMQEQLAPYIGKELTELVPVLSNLGYTANYIAENTDMDFTEQLRIDETYAELFIVTGFRKIDETAHTLEVLMLGKDTVADMEKDKQAEAMEYALNEKLAVSIAWDAVKDYGKTQYSSFKLHNRIGKLEEKADDENTWFLKATCEVNGIDNMNCEAQVTGTSAYPIVIYFQVY